MTELDFFDKGYHITKAPESIITDLWRLVYTSEWVKTPHKTYLQYDVDNFRVPTWHPEIVSGSPKPEEGNHYWGSKDIDKQPKEFVSIGEEISKLQLFDVLRSYGRTPTLKYLSAWNGAADLPWHSDINDSTDIIVLVYLTEEEMWDDSWGGTIQFRRIGNNTSTHRKLQPLNGNMVVMNNTNPLMQHKTSPMINPYVNRYTFNFCYSWT